MHIHPPTHTPTHIPRRLRWSSTSIRPRWYQSSASDNSVAAADISSTASSPLPFPAISCATYVHTCIFICVVLSRGHEVYGFFAFSLPPFHTIYLCMHVYICKCMCVTCSGWHSTALSHLPFPLVFCATCVIMPLHAGLHVSYTAFYVSVSGQWLKLCVYVYIDIYVCIFMCIYIFVQSRIYIYVYVYAYMYRYLYVYVCTYTYIYINIYTYIHTYIYIHTVIHTSECFVCMYVPWVSRRASRMSYIHTDVHIKKKNMSHLRITHGTWATV